jgi:hypothetical protein
MVSRVQGSIPKDFFRVAGNNARFLMNICLCVMSYELNIVIFAFFNYYLSLASKYLLKICLRIIHVRYNRTFSYREAT